MTMMMDDNLLQEFLAESREHLCAIEPDLLELEKNASATADATINSIFRAIHSIKGASGFFGFEKLKHFSHIMESVLMMIRDKTLEPSPAVVDVLLNGVDRLNEMVDDIQQSENVDVANEQAKLEALLNGSSVDQASMPPSPAEPYIAETSSTPPVAATTTCPFDLNTPEVKQAQAGGQYLYVLTVFPKVDFNGETTPIAMLENLASVGSLLATTTPTGEALVLDELPLYLDAETSEYETVYLLYGSVLEADLLPATLHVPQNQFCLAENFTPPTQETLCVEPSFNTPTESSNSPFDLNTPELNQARAGGQYIYVLAIHPGISFAQLPFGDFYGTLNTVGQFWGGYTPSQGVLSAASLPETVPSATEDIYLLYSTVLEPTLLPPTSGLPQQDVYLAEQFKLSKDEPKDRAVTSSGVTADLPSPEVSLTTSGSSKDVEPPSGNASTSSASVQETIRVRVELLNRLMNLAGEMVLLRNQLNQKLDTRVEAVEGLNSVLQNINHTTTELQEHIMQTRMQPIGNVFSKFNRVVRDVARALNKKIEIEISGNEVELDKSIVESLSDPLTHLIRNSCDHGIEAPEDRRKLGKPEHGQINLRAFQEGGQIIISIQDDGKGIDADRLVEKALEKGVIQPAEAERMSSKDKVNLIFHPGFSMAKEISDISGRGVGMDVVRTNIEKLGGTIEVETEVGMGTIIYLHLPLTLAIIPSLLVGTHDLQFAIPQINVVELLRVKAEDVPKQIETVGSATVLRLRGKLLPLVRLSDALGLPRTYIDPETGERKEERRLSLSERRQQMEHPEVDFAEDGRMMLPRADYETKNGDRRAQPYQDTTIVVLKMGGKQYGLVVEDVENLEEIVVKPLSQYLQNCKCFAGSTIMGDGSVAMIIDVGGVATEARLDFSKVEKEEDERQKAHHTSSNALLTEMEVILFALTHATDGDRFAVPLQSVLRLEKFNLDDIQMVGQKEFLTYQGRSLPLIRLEHSLPIQGPNAQDVSSNDAYLIIPRAGGTAGHGNAAIVAQRIVDVDKVAVHLEASHMHHPGVKGAAVIDDTITTFIEPQGFLPAQSSIA